MPHRDIHHNILPFWCYDVIGSTISGTISCGEINLQGYNAVELIAITGSAIVSALTDASCWQLRIQEADASGASAGTFADVSDGNYILGGTGSAALTSGVWQTVNATSGESGVWSVGYIGPKQFVRVIAESVGTPPDIPFATLAILGIPDLRPVQ